MIWDFSRLPINYRRFCHYARAICTFDWDLLHLNRVDVVPSVDVLGWAKLSQQFGAHAEIGIRVNDPELRAWGKDCFGQAAPWADKANAFRSKIYMKLGCGEWTLATDLTQAFTLIGYCIVENNEWRQQQLVELFGMEEAAHDSGVWMLAAFKAFTPLYLPGVNEDVAARFRQVVTSR